jgi:helix-turn-helix protein
MSTPTVTTNGARDDDDRMLSEREAAAFLSLCPKTLAVWRGQRRGPRYARFGRAIRYRLGDVREYLQTVTVEPRAGDGA